MITTIIPVYLREEGDLERLNRALDSIVTQSIKPKTVLISDDSTNVELIKQLNNLLLKTQLNVEYVTNPGKPNASDNTNFAVHQATTEIIHILHQDDWLVDSSFYEEIQEAIINRGYLWTLAKGITSGSENIPKIEPTLLFGFNSIGGPSALAMRRESWINLNSEFLLLPDVIQFTQLSQSSGIPYVTSKICIEYGTGDHKMTHRISMSEISQDISKLFALNLVTKFPFKDLLLNSRYWGSYLENLSDCISKNSNLDPGLRFQALILKKVCQKYLYMIKIKMAISFSKSIFHKRNRH